MPSPARPAANSGTSRAKRSCRASAPGYEQLCPPGLSTRAADAFAARLSVTTFRHRATGLGTALGVRARRSAISRTTPGCARALQRVSPRSRRRRTRSRARAPAPTSRSARASSPPQVSPTPSGRPSAPTTSCGSPTTSPTWVRLRLRTSLRRLTRVPEWPRLTGGATRRCVRRQARSFSGVHCDRETPHLRADTESRMDLRIPLAFDVRTPASVCYRCERARAQERGVDTR